MKIERTCWLDTATWRVPNSWRPDVRELLGKGRCSHSMVGVVCVLLFFFSTHALFCNQFKSCGSNTVQCRLAVRILSTRVFSWTCPKTAAAHQSASPRARRSSRRPHILYLEITTHGCLNWNVYVLTTKICPISFFISNMCVFNCCFLFL